MGLFNRVSRRNLLRALRAARIDVKPRGPNVSDDIQLVYIVDDISPELYAYAAVGDFTGVRAGRNHMLEIECRNEGGLVIDEMVGVVPTTAGSRLDVKIYIETFPETLTEEVFEPLAWSINNPAARVRSGNADPSAFNSGQPGFTVHLLGGGAAGTIQAGAPVGMLQGLWMPQGSFLKTIDTQTGHASQWSLRWHELG